MPKAVDHDQRRREIVEVYLRLVARDGLERATTRAVADELGVASGALWHYFDNTDALLGAAAARVVENTNSRIAAATSGLRGLERLRATMSQILPVDKVTRDEAHVVVGFWGRAATRSILAETSNAWYDEWTSLLRLALGEAINDGELLPTTPIDAILRLLTSVTNGQQIAEVLRPPGGRYPDHLVLVEDSLRPFAAPRPLRTN